MKKHKQFSLASVILFAICYLITSFIKVDLNMVNWSEDTRIVLILCWLVLEFPMFMAIYFPENQN